MTDSKTFPSVTPRQVQAANWPGSGIDPGSTFLVPPGRIKTCLYGWKDWGRIPAGWNGRSSWLTPPQVQFAGTRPSQIVHILKECKQLYTIVNGPDAADCTEAAEKCDNCTSVFFSLFKGHLLCQKEVQLLR